MFRIISIFLIALFTCNLNAQMVDKAIQGTFLLQNATIHTITNGVMEGDVLIVDSKITQLGQGLSSENATIIDCTGKHIYPGLIDSGTRLGLAEVESISLTQDFNELGSFVPHMQALTAVNPNSVNIPVTRTNGVTTVISKPSGGLFPGTAALIDLVGYTPEKMYANFKGVILNFPSTGKRGRWDRRSKEEVKKDSDKALKKLDEIWEKAMLYHKIDSTSTASNNEFLDYNPQMDALLPVIRGEIKLMVEVNKKKDILNAIKWLEDNKIENAILTGVDEGFKVAKEIKESGYPVITGPVLDIPNRSYDRYDVSYKNAGIMSKAGVLVALRTNEAENVRNLPFNAG